MDKVLDDDAGYTLLELLVAVAITALMAVPVAEGLRKGINSWNISHELADGSEENLLMRQRIATWVRAAYPADPLRHGSIIEPALTGQIDSLSFIGAVHPSGQSDDLYAVIISKNSDGNLVATLKSDIDSGGPDFAEAVLLSGVDTVLFTYLQSPKGVTADWVATWIDRSVLPRAVKLSVSFTDNEVFWPDLVMPLDVKEWGHCAYDPVALACRSGGAG